MVEGRCKSAIDWSLTLRIYLLNIKNDIDHIYPCILISLFGDAAIGGALLKSCFQKIVVLFYRTPSGNYIWI